MGYIHYERVPGFRSSNMLSAEGQSCYINREDGIDEREGRSYRWKAEDEDLVEKHLVPSSDAPAWVQEHAKNGTTLEFWKDYQSAEDRYLARWHASKGPDVVEDLQDRALIDFRDIAVLPQELDVDQLKALSAEFIDSEFTQQGITVTYALHLHEGNPHLHIQGVTRKLTSEGVGSRLPHFNRRGEREGKLRAARENFARIGNRHLVDAGHAPRLDHRSYAEQGIELEPTIHEGYAARLLHADGVPETRVSENLLRRVRNGARLTNDPGEIITEVFANRATATEADLKTALFNRLMTEDRFDELSARLMASPELVPLSEDAYGRLRFTTRSYLATEQRAIANMEALASRDGHAVDLSRLADAVEKTYAELPTTEGERAELVDILKTIMAPRDLAVLEGWAGTGKTTLLNVVNQEYVAQGYEVRGFALSGQAAQNLQTETGIKSTTIDAYTFRKRQIERIEQELKTRSDAKTGQVLSDRELKMRERQLGKFKDATRLTERDIIVVDEGGMVGIGHADELVADAIDAGAKVIEVGDQAQFKAISAGDQFRKAVEISKKEGTYARLTKIVRQDASQPWMRQATVQLSDGETRAAIEQYDAHGMIKLADTTAEAKQQLVAEYFVDRDAQPAKVHEVLTSTRADAEELNRMIREVAVGRGDITDSVSIHGRDFGVGDRIMFLKNIDEVEAVERTVGTASRLSARRLIRSVMKVRAIWKHEPHNIVKLARSGSRYVIDRSAIPSPADKPVSSAEGPIQTIAGEKLGVRNGTTGNIKGVYQQGDDVRFVVEVERTGRRLMVDPMAIPEGFTHGFAATGHKKQGASGNVVKYLPDNAKEDASLVNMTRHRDSLKVYAGKDRFPEVKHLADVMQRASTKDLAADYSGGAEQREQISTIRHYKKLRMETGDLYRKMALETAPKRLRDHPEHGDFQSLTDQRREVAKDIAELRRAAKVDASAGEASAHVRAHDLGQLVDKRDDLADQIKAMRSRLEEDCKGIEIFEHPQWDEFLAKSAERKVEAQYVYDRWDELNFYARTAHITKEKVMIDAGLRERPLTLAEKAARENMHRYSDLVDTARTKWNEIQSTHRGAHSRNHPDYKVFDGMRADRDDLAAEIKRAPKLHKQFTKEAEVSWRTLVRHASASEDRASEAARMMGFDPAERRAALHVQTYKDLRQRALAAHFDGDTDLSQVLTRKAEALAARISRDYDAYEPEIAHLRIDPERLRADAGRFEIRSGIRSAINAPADDIGTSPRMLEGLKRAFNAVENNPQLARFAAGFSKANGLKWQTVTRTVRASSRDGLVQTATNVGASPADVARLRQVDAYTRLSDASYVARDIGDHSTARLLGRKAEALAGRFNRDPLAYHAALKRMNVDPQQLQADTARQEIRDGLKAAARSVKGGDERGIGEAAGRVLRAIGADPGREKFAAALAKDNGVQWRAIAKQGSTHLRADHETAQLEKLEPEAQKLAQHVGAYRDLHHRAGTARMQGDFAKAENLSQRAELMASRILKEPDRYAEPMKVLNVTEMDLGASAVRYDIRDALRTISTAQRAGMPDRLDAGVRRLFSAIGGNERLEKYAAVKSRQAGLRFADLKTTAAKLPPADAAQPVGARADMLNALETRVAAWRQEDAERAFQRVLDKMVSGEDVAARMHIDVIREKEQASLDIDSAIADLRAGNMPEAKEKLERLVQRFNTKTAELRQSDNRTRTPGAGDRAASDLQVADKGVEVGELPEETASIVRLGASLLALL